MSWGWQIYLIGYVAAFIYWIQIFKDKTNRILSTDLLAGVFLSLFSWTMVVALWLGGNIKYSEDHRNDDNNNINDDIN